MKKICFFLALALCTLFSCCSLNEGAESSITLSVQGRAASDSAYIGVYEENSRKIYTGSITAGNGTATITLEGYPLGPASFLIALAPDTSRFYIGYTQLDLQAGENVVPVKLSSLRQKTEIDVRDDQTNPYDGELTVQLTPASGERFSIYIIDIQYEHISFQDDRTTHMNTFPYSKSNWFVCDNQNQDSRIYTVKFKQIRYTNKIAIKSISLTNYTTGKTYRATYDSAPAAGSEAELTDTNTSATYTCTVE